MNINFNLLILFILGALGAAGAGVAVFFLVRSRFESIEERVNLATGHYANEVYDLLDRMYKRKTMEQCYRIILIPALVMGFIGLVIGIKFGFLESLIFAAIFGMIGYRAPGIIIRGMFKRRIELFDRQLVDALTMMTSALRSGLSFMQVIQVLERELPNPAAQEFGMVLRENRVGVNINDALLNLIKRVPSDDLFMIVNSVVTLSQQGGDLSEAFETIAVTIRERQKIMEKIRTMSQAAITQATILSLIPLVMLFFMYLMQPKYVMLLFTTPLGIAMMIFMFTMMGVGGLWMKKILAIEV